MQLFYVKWIPKLTKTIKNYKPKENLLKVKYDVVLIRLHVFGSQFLDSVTSVSVLYRKMFIGKLIIHSYKIIITLVLLKKFNI